MQIIDILLQAFLISFILVGVHSYFGREIIRRGIIFTDLAVGQFSALGLAFSLLLLDGKYTYPIMLFFSILGALLIYFSKKFKEYQEAFIGIFYALGLSSTILTLSQLTHSTEEFMQLSATDILFTPKRDIIINGFYYLVIASLIFITNRYLKGFRELFFYILFALTLTSSVRLAGVFVVFTLLLAPALMSILLKRSFIFAWIYGSIINAWAIIFSFLFDFPTGFSIVFWQSLSILPTLFLGKQ